MKKVALLWLTVERFNSFQFGKADFEFEAQKKRLYLAFLVAEGSEMSKNSKRGWELSRVGKMIEILLKSPSRHSLRFSKIRKSFFDLIQVYFELKTI